MTEQLNDYFQKGLVFEAFQAERNILIWQHVANETDFLKTKDQPVQKLYSFIQQSAQTNFILCLGKLYDNPSKNYPTRCILSFLKMLQESSLEAVSIIETIGTKNVLVQFDCPMELIDSVDNLDFGLFPKLFATVYLARYTDTELQKDIQILRAMRDKGVAHNEVFGDLYFPFESATRLLAFVAEIITIFGIAYHSTIWRIAEFSFLKKNAERDSFFVKSNIDGLKLSCPVIVD